MTEEWRTVSLGDVMEETKPAKVDEPWLYPLLTVRLHGMGVTPSGKKPNRTSKGRPHFVRQPGTLLVGRQNFCRGGVGLVPGTKEPHVTSSAISGFTAKAGTSNAFLLHVLLSREVQDAALVLSTGTGQQEISVQSLLGIETRMPPLSVQRRIADFMEHLDTHIENLEAEATASLRVAERLRNDLPPGVPTKLNAILQSIDSGFSPVTPGDPPLAGQARVLKVSAVHAGLFRPEEAKGLVDGTEIPERARLAAGDVLISRANTPERVALCARARRVPPNTFFPDLLWRIVPTDRIDADYLEQVLASTSVRERLAARSGGSSTSMSKINKTVLRDLEIPLPSIDVQRSHAATCLTAGTAWDSLSGELERVREFRGRLISAFLSRAVELPESYEELLGVAS